jgi:DUF4097 and DUF4098 domain-containing protein YvlB
VQGKQLSTLSSARATEAGRCAMKVHDCAELPLALAALISLLALAAGAQEKKETRYVVGRNPIVSITNKYGPVTVKPSKNRQVVVGTTSHLNRIKFVNKQRGNRIEVRADASDRGSALVEYRVLVPSDAFVSLRSSNGTLRAEGLRGDLVVESVSSSVDVSDIADAHVHVRTLSGPVTLNGIRDSHVDVRSVSGNVTIRNVAGPSLEVNSGSGRITYDGDPAASGAYLLTSHSGDLDVSIPAKASVEIKVRSLKSESDRGFTNSDAIPATRQKDLLMKPGIVNASKFVLRSIRGKIHLKRP